MSARSARERSGNAGKTSKPSIWSSSAKSKPSAKSSAKQAKTASRTRSGRTRGSSGPKAKTRSSGPIVFFIALFIVALGSIQLLSTLYTYAINLSELNGLKRQEAALIAKKQELENSIARWNDDAYVAAQARERLGFVFPGEQAVTVLHPEAVTGKPQSDGDTSSQAESDKKTLPWYSELAYSIEKADSADTSATDIGSAASGSGKQTDAKNSAGSSTDQSNQTSQDNTDSRANGTTTDSKKDQ
ncbi:septum formation initiator family protein [Bifidobacterium sp. 82T10]|uniref:Septum formation initiator family protein n=1 Tax=Bifidobacterium miconis TaxID=2834435 RepID=A0ABS6WDV2_9BIFI|nr:septum formation initiator family protein [Bifidobacterium miconis]MBW3092229.1 septum formation initiator family protein [Bifidobacterium miconis]